MKHEDTVNRRRLLGALGRGAGLLGLGALASACAEDSEAANDESIAHLAKAVVNVSEGGEWVTAVKANMKADYLGETFTDLTGAVISYAVEDVGEGGAAYKHRPGVSWVDGPTVLIRAGHVLSPEHHIMRIDLWPYQLGVDAPTAPDGAAVAAADMLDDKYCLEGEVTIASGDVGFVLATVCNTDGVFFGSGQVHFPNLLSVI